MVRKIVGLLLWTALGCAGESVATIGAELERCPDEVRDGSACDRELHACRTEVDVCECTERDEGRTWVCDAAPVMDECRARREDSEAACREALDACLEPVDERAEDERPAADEA